LIPQDSIGKIFDAADIVEVIGEFVTLKKSGSNYKGLSPFVNEKTPSFMVSPAKQIFKCFSSSKGGNVVSFIMEHEQYSYPEALRWLADKYGIHIEEKKLTPEEEDSRNERESLFIVNQWAQTHFSELMTTDKEGKAIGLSYFKERGFREDIIEKFQLGYCLDSWDAFNKAAVKAGYKTEFLEKLGLIKKKDDGKHFDFYKGRVMFPIHSLTGRVLGFGGRTLRSDKKIAKYFNSPESEIYNKSKILYGLYFAKREIVNLSNCFLVEGYTDVISMFQSGVENVVASSGTSLTVDQIKLIKRYTDNITILYDGDNAGIKASFRGIDLILEQGMNVKVVLFPDGEDPDSYAKSVSTEELNKYLEDNAQDFISFKSGLLLDETKNDPIKRAKLITEIVQSIALIPDQITRQVYIQQASSQMDIGEQALINTLNKLRRENHNTAIKKSTGYTPAPASNVDNPGVEPVPHEEEQQSAKKKDNYQERDLMHKLLVFASYGIEITEENEEGEEQSFEMSVAQFIVDEIGGDDIKLEDEVNQRIFDVFAQGIKDGVIPSTKHFVTHEDQEISGRAADLMAEKHTLSENWEKKHKIYPETEEMRLNRAVQEVVWKYKLDKIRTMAKSMQEELKDCTSVDQEMSIMKKLILLQNGIEAISEKLTIVISE